ncbi:hypothetical protein C8F01DRAFT_1253223 [Mycena amicta]|nr:hypothetical protein C8F01DRAFT_1253223 [Mycena amicta]
MPPAPKKTKPGKGGGKGVKKAASGGKTTTTETSVEIDWNGDHDLTSALITAIEDDSLMRDALFPAPGPNKRTGGLPKKTYHQKAAIAIFSTHPQYQDQFAKATDAAGKEIWSNKIKNRLTAITTKARGYINEMGQTGAGLDSEQDISPGTSLATKWDVIKAEFPWFWRMRALIGERPNLRPTGIGDVQTVIDTSILLPNPDDREGSPTRWDIESQETPGRALTDSSIAGDGNELSDEDGEDKPVSGDVIDVSDGEEPAEDVDGDEKEHEKPKKKRKRAESPAAHPPSKKTKPKAAISAPTANPEKLKAEAAAGKGPGPKRSKAEDRFQAQVVAEEETGRLALNVRKEKLQVQKAVEVAKINGEAMAKAEKVKAKGETALAKLELAKLKMQQDHEYRMATVQQPISASAALNNELFGSGSSTPNDGYHYSLSSYNNRSE